MPELSPQPQVVAPFEQLNRRFRPALMAFFLRRLGSHAEAEDLTQEVFVRITAMDVGRMTSSEAYIFQMAANLLRDRSRREKVRFDFRADAMADEQSGLDLREPSRVAASRQSLERLESALRALPDTTRNMFVLYRLEHVDRRDIAAAFGTSLSTVDRHLARAMAHLTRSMRDDE
ncbi:RNA polymerase sigma factor [Marilutibacter alkalisoli]|uniref:Sigma-70 family RNA polymerase sigma factor n=1 Tax=Marilutibacter alkalisoli TaxID=2591633 RepID=A0A514BVU6_9GAMM|nr:sigma-70 family RNA polymerase sigma factor [Lysobacter alkalisoli]QDH71506.1 sigma-70 family RNA polymerase sigma factor [Lysobacter alkalisoli]